VYTAILLILLNIIIFSRNVHGVLALDLKKGLDKLKNMPSIKKGIEKLKQLPEM